MIKCRGCADGKKQRDTVAKGEESFLTMAIETVLLIYIVDDEENQVVTVTDIPGAYLSTNTDKLAHAQLDSHTTELLVKVKLELYRKHVPMSNGKYMLYIVLHRALYGYLKSSLLFWRHLLSVLVKLGLQKNPYDTCMANKVINGYQCIISWKLDNLKVSHKHHKVFNDVISILEKTYSVMTTQKSKVLEYLSTTINFSEEKKAHIKVDTFAETLLTDSPEGMKVEVKLQQLIFI